MLQPLARPRRVAPLEAERQTNLSQPRGRHPRVPRVRWPTASFSTSSSATASSTCSGTTTLTVARCASAQTPATPEAGTPPNTYPNTQVSLIQCHHPDYSDHDGVIQFLSVSIYPLNLSFQSGTFIRDKRVTYTYFVFLQVKTTVTSVTAASVL